VHESGTERTRQPLAPSRGGLRDGRWRLTIGQSRRRDRGCRRADIRVAAEQPLAVIVRRYRVCTSRGISCNCLLPLHPGSPCAGRRDAYPSMPVDATTCGEWQRRDRHGIACSCLLPVPPALPCARRQGAARRTCRPRLPRRVQSNKLRRLRWRVHMHAFVILSSIRA
jgi:hypothetical protein